MLRGSFSGGMGSFNLIEILELLLRKFKNGSHKNGQMGPCRSLNLTQPNLISWDLVGP